MDQKQTRTLEKIRDGAWDIVLSTDEYADAKAAIEDAHHERQRKVEEARHGRITEIAALLVMGQELLPSDLQEFSKWLDDHAVPS